MSGHVCGRNKNDGTDTATVNLTTVGHQTTQRGTSNHKRKPNHVIQPQREGSATLHLDAFRCIHSAVLAGVSVDRLLFRNSRWSFSNSLFALNINDHPDTIWMAIGRINTRNALRLSLWKPPATVAWVPWSVLLTNPEHMPI